MATKKGLWLVMDGRARFDVDVATIFEAQQGTEDLPLWKWAKRNWSGYDACLCFAPEIEEGKVGPAQYVGEVGGKR